LNLKRGVGTRPDRATYPVCSVTANPGDTAGSADWPLAVMYALSTLPGGLPAPSHDSWCAGCREAFQSVIADELGRRRD
jgi:hypothetical protein